MSLASTRGAWLSSSRISRFNTVALAGGCLLVLGAGTAPKVACLQESGSAGEVRQSAAPELAGAIATALNSTLERRGWSVTPAGDGSGFAFKVSGPKGSPMEFELPTLTDILDRVARGETGFAEVGGTGIEEEGSPPDWVPVYPGVRSNASTSVKTADLVVGGGVYVADASIADVLMWYFNWADRIGTKGKGAAETESRRIARELGLPIDEEGRVLYPDAQIEYEDADGRTGRVNVEAVSGSYREAAVRAKAAAGFAMHANGPAAAGLLRRLGLGSDNGSWLRGPTDRDPASVEL